MKQLGITKGTWRTVCYAGYWNIQSGEFYSAYDNLLDESDFDEAEENAKLMAEAGTIANKCGFTPSELLSQRDRLLKALLKLHELAVSEEPPIEEEFEAVDIMVESTLNEILTDIFNRTKDAAHNDNKG